MMRVLGLLALGALGPAWAQEPAQPSGEAPPGEAEDAEDAEDSEDSEDSEGPSTTGRAIAEVVASGGSEEIIVFEDIEVQRRRARVDADIRSLGYRPGIRKDDRVVYRPEIPWKPSVVVYDEGYVIIKRSPVRFAAPTRKQRPIDYLWCLPPFTPMCVRVGGQIVSEAKLQPQKYRVAQGIDPDFRDWRQAIVANAWAERIGEQIPDQLDAAWAQGVPFEGEGSLSTPAERRQAIVAFRASRACTPEGMEVRQLVDLFLEHEVQQSTTPLTPDEVQTAAETDLCGTPLGFSLGAP